MVKRRRCKVAIIGAGSAGLAAHAMARRRSDDVLLIEGGEYGTTCARSGCMPSKLLIAAADARAAVARAAEFGLSVPGVEVDRTAVMQRVRSHRDRFVGSVLDVVKRIAPEQRLRGHARFVAPDRLDVDGQQVEAERIVIATGSRPRVPAGFAALGDRLLTSDNVFELARLPDSVAVLGGGVIGLELGQALHRLGVRVRLFDRKRQLGPRGDPEVSALATAQFSASLPCELGVKLKATASADGVELVWSDAGREQRDSFEYLLLAIGREPNVDALGLSTAGIECDDRGVPVFDRATMRCGDSTIFIAGDVDGDEPLLHVAAEDGRIAGDNAARFPEVRAHRRQVRLAVAFTDPQWATIGVQLDEPAGRGAAVGQVSFATQGRSQVVARNVGIARLYGDPASSKLIGAQLLSPYAEHLAHLLAWAIQQELNVHELLAMPFYHPVVEEGLRTALVDLRHTLRRGGALSRDCLDCGPGG